MVTKMETVLDTVKISLGFSQAEADHYLTIHEEAGFVVVKLRAKSYMEPTTWNAFIALMKQLGAVHEKENSPTFEIPIQTSGPTQTVTPPAGRSHNRLQFSQFQRRSWRISSCSR